MFLKIKIFLKIQIFELVSLHYNSCLSVHNEDIILRGCQFSPTNNMDICKKIKNDVGKQPPINVTFCELCDNDGCNSARKPETHLNALFLSAIIALFAQCCLVYVI